jgi:hypothetical protein
MLVGLARILGVYAPCCLAEALAGAEATPVYRPAASWQQSLLLTREAVLRAQGTRKDKRNWQSQIDDNMACDFPLEWDWFDQDAGERRWQWFMQDNGLALDRLIIKKVLQELGTEGRALRVEYERLVQDRPSPGDQPWFDLYVKACKQRREIRLRRVNAKCPKIVFTKHYNIGGSHYAYTEGVSDAMRERHFTPGTSLCLWEAQGLRGKVRTLINDPNGVIRDPDVSYDGKRILFAWKKSDRQDDYHLYEMELATGAIRQLTFGLGYADYECNYLPNGDIIFNSTRCGQSVDCASPEVSNLYTCDANGAYMRRLSVDQVHTNFPTVTSDGRVIYTRWDYNDRGQVYPQPLFQMNPDGTYQTELYGNNSWFPTTIMHARGIPESGKIVAVLSGHHSHQRGKLAIIDPRLGRQEATGVQLIAPIRGTKAVRVDAYGQSGEQFQYPYALSETEFLVTYTPVHSGNRKYRRPYGVYFMTIDGRRELLAFDPKVSSNQAVPLAPRPRPHIRPRLSDYRQAEGVFYLHDIYNGPGLAGIQRGTVKALRVIKLEYRAASIRANFARGPGGQGHANTPVSIGSGTWDVKVVLGDATVHPDGSACFKVPALTPVYFQAIDAKGHAVQTMRSWSTLQPGETLSCVGCHEHKNAAPANYTGKTAAQLTGPETLSPFYGAPRGFSFNREIQPILDRHCVHCHKDRTKRLYKAGRQGANNTPPHTGPIESLSTAKGRQEILAFSLLGEQTPEEKAGRKWSDAYLALTRPRLVSGYLSGRSNTLVNWIGSQSVPTMLPPYHAGAATSQLIKQLEEGHQGVKLSQEEMDKIACWIDLLVPYCGDYLEANIWTDQELDKYDYYLQKRYRMEKLERANIAKLIEHEGS